MQAQPELDFNAREEQRANLVRVSNNIAGIVRDFCRERLDDERAEFHMVDLTIYVNARSTIAPDSAGRILRDLRKQKVIDYTVVSRSQSLYRVEGVSSE
jgi:hypothetical protein